MPRFTPSHPATAPAHPRTLAETETWLRREGLPFFVTPRRRASLLIARASPFVVAAFYVDVARWLGVNVPLTVGDDVVGVVAAVLSVTVVWVGVPLGAFLSTARLVRERPSRMTGVGAVLLGGFIVLEPWLDTSGSLTGLIAAALVDAGLVAAALLATWLGVGSVAAWAARTTARRVRALGLVATRAVPLLMLVVIFAVFSRSLWEITGTLTDARLLAVIGFFVALDLLVVVPLTRSELMLDAREPDDGFGPPLSRLERGNVMVVLILAQCLQVVIFFALVAAFLLALGTIVFADGVLAGWAGTEPEAFTLAGVVFPFDVVLVKTTLFLSCVSSLNFLVSASNQAAYKSAFYDPLFLAARAALAVRSEYLAEAEIGVHTEV